jgi:hypothetical protein
MVAEDDFTMGDRSTIFKERAKKSNRNSSSKSFKHAERPFQSLIDQFWNEPGYNGGSWIALTLESLQNCKSLKIMRKRYSDKQFISFFRWFAVNVVKEASMLNDPIRKRYFPGIANALIALSGLLNDQNERLRLSLFFGVSQEEFDETKGGLDNLLSKLIIYENKIKSIDTLLKETKTEQVKNPLHRYMLMTAAEVDKIFGKRWPKFIEDLFDSPGIKYLIEGKRLKADSIRRLFSRTAKDKDIPGIYLKKNPGFK